MRNLLILGDHTIVQYARALEADGFQVAAQPPGSAPNDADFDAVILHLPSVAEDASAKGFLEAAKSGESPALIAMISPEQTQSFDPAKGLDDFLLTTAPPEELCARVRQALWRRHGVDARNILKCGDLEMDLANYTVHIAGRPVELTYKEYELLRFLATNRDRVFNRETLLNKVWGYDFYGGARTVDVHIRRLRSKIEDRHSPFIETVRNVGYRFRA
jgi:DNA-binding response OmpR family regulator